MFKKYTKQLFFYGLLLFSGAICSAADGSDDGGCSSSSWGKQPQGKLDKGDPFGLHAKAHAEYKESLKPKRIIPDEMFDQIITRYTIDLPSVKDAERVVNRVIKQHPGLKPIIQSIKDPNLCQYFTYPSQLLFVGPSGCGKTHAAKALAKYCNKQCVFIEGSEVGNTYRNSGSTLITDLFKGMLERPEKGFMVIIDEFMAVAKFIDDDKEMQQNKTATALWKGLDRCADKKHVCVVATDNGDPATLTEALKTRFSYDIFRFRHMEQDGILEVIEECLSDNVNGVMPEYRAGFLNQFTKSVKHLPIRQIKKLIERGKMLAVTEKNDPKAIATEDDLMRALDIYRDPTWLEKVWMDRDTHISNLTSARAASIYMLVGGLGLSSQDYKYGAMLMGLGGFVNAYWAEGKDLQLFGLVHHMFAQYESRRQWETSHQFNVQNSEEAKAARARDEKRANEQLELSREANERAKSDQIFKIKEALKRIAMDHEVDRSHDQYSLRTGTKKELSEHYAYLQEELKKLELEEEKKNETEAKGEDACTLS